MFAWKVINKRDSWIVNSKAIVKEKLRFRKIIKSHWDKIWRNSYYKPHTTFFPFCPPLLFLARYFDLELHRKLSVFVELLFAVNRKVWDSFSLQIQQYIGSIQRSNFNNWFHAVSFINIFKHNGMYSLKKNQCQKLQSKFQKNS